MLDLPSTEEQKSRLAQLRNREWLDSNIDEIQREYRDQWVGILDGGVVAHGDDVKLVQQAVESREAEAVIMRVPKDPIPTPI